MTKHYIRIDLNNNIIKGFSSDFESPQETDICINENGGRHFEINGIVNPSLVNLKMIPLYKYIDNEILLRTDEEIQVDELTLPKSPLSMEEKLALLQKAMDDLIFGGV